jgi:hypothetical protein
MDTCSCEYLWYKGNTNFPKWKKIGDLKMANPRYNSQVTQPRGTKARVGKMGGGMMMQRPMYKAGGRIAGAARRAQQHGYYTPDMGMKGGKMYAKGGKVSGKKKIMAVGRGKAKDYPGIKKLIEMNKKGKKRFRDGGSALKQVKPSQKGLKKLPTKVRNKMGYMKKGGRVGEMMYSRGYGEGMKSKRKPTELMDRGAMKKGGRVHKNTRRMNRLEELGRVDAEKGRTRKGKRNLRDEKKRIVRELKK